MGLAGCAANAILKLNTGHYYVMYICSMSIPTVYYLVYYMKDRWTTGIFGLLAVFYLLKIPKDIVANQEIRKHDWPIIEQIAERANNGEKIYVYKPIDEYNKMPQWDKIFYDYYHLVLQNMVRMHTCNQEFILTETDECGCLSIPSVFLVSDYIDQTHLDCTYLSTGLKLSNMNVFFITENN